DPNARGCKKGRGQNIAKQVLNQRSRGRIILWILFGFLQFFKKPVLSTGFIQQREKTASEFVFFS
ncbi:MAG: hypothetical protein OER43_13285, partial [Gammaproteobacteria bacterium]|nr:hypothetical protein [Gammaproteobacteria bacterium]